MIGGKLGVNLLHAYAGNGVKVGLAEAPVYENQSKLEVLLGEGFFSEIRNKTVIDFGCADGDEAIEIAKRGARRVIGVDIQERYLEVARVAAQKEGVAEKCEFTVHPSEAADLIVALDSFEHFDNPAEILETMHSMLNPSGKVMISFGPTWYHPYGGHLFSVFPWAHLIFTERALIRWRSGFKTDGATRFSEVEGGLNQMTIRRFRTLVNNSPFKFLEFEAVPIRRLIWLANALTEEFTTAIVRCTLVPRDRR